MKCIHNHLNQTISIGLNIINVVNDDCVLMNVYSIRLVVGEKANINDMREKI